MKLWNFLITASSVRSNKTMIGRETTRDLRLEMFTSFPRRRSGLPWFAERDRWISLRIAEFQSIHGYVSDNECGLVCAYVGRLSPRTCYTNTYMITRSTLLLMLGHVPAGKGASLVNETAQWTLEFSVRARAAEGKTYSQRNIQSSFKFLLKSFEITRQILTSLSSSFFILLRHITKQRGSFSCTVFFVGSKWIAREGR